MNERLKIQKSSRQTYSSQEILLEHIPNSILVPRVMFPIILLVRLVRDQFTLRISQSACNLYVSVEEGSIFDPAVLPQFGFCAA